jgi:hypothetical protein
MFDTYRDRMPKRTPSRLVFVVAPNIAATSWDRLGGRKCLADIVCREKRKSSGKGWGYSEASV